MSSASPAAAAAALAPRRLALNLSERAYQDLKECAESSSRTMTDVIRIGIGLFKVAQEVVAQKNKLVVVSPSGEPLKEIVLPL